MADLVASFLGTPFGPLVLVCAVAVLAHVTVRAAVRFVADAAYVGVLMAAVQFAWPYVASRGQALLETIPQEFVERYFNNTVFHYWWQQ